MCRRLDINEKHIKLDVGGDNASIPPVHSHTSEQPTVAALKFLIVPVIMKENIRPKVSTVFLFASLLYYFLYLRLCSCNMRSNTCTFYCRC
jgi:hypothetical protein